MDIKVKHGQVHTVHSRRCEIIFLVTVYIISCVSVYLDIVD